MCRQASSGWIFFFNGVGLVPSRISRPPMLPQRREDISQSHVVVESAQMVVRQGIVVLVAFIPFRAEAKRGENPRSSDVQNLLQVSLPYSTSDIRFFAPCFSFSRFLASYTALLFVRILSSIDSLCTRGTLNNNTGSLIVDISTSLCTTNAIDFLRISRTHRLSPNPIGPPLPLTLSITRASTVSPRRRLPPSSPKVFTTLVRTLSARGLQVLGFYGFEP